MRAEAGEAGIDVPSLDNLRQAAAPHPGVESVKTCNVSPLVPDVRRRLGTQ